MPAQKTHQVRQPRDRRVIIHIDASPDRLPPQELGRRSHENREHDLKKGWRRRPKHRGRDES